VSRAERKPYLFHSVDRALRLLELVANESEPRTVRELANISGYERTMTYRLLSTLESHRFVDRDPVTRTYSLGLSATALSSPTAYSLALVRRAHPELERLMREVSQTVSLGISQRWSGVVIDQIDPPNPIRLVNNVNVPLPLHCTSNGKVILSRLSEAELESFLRSPLERQTKSTITSPTRLRREIERTRARGYAAGVDELSDGVSAVSVELLDSRGEFVATITVSGPSWQFEANHFSMLAARMHRAARAIFPADGDDPAGERDLSERSQLEETAARAYPSIRVGTSPRIAP
jgi:DNA-binding IclR family transcriptional regulator